MLSQKDFIHSEYYQKLSKHLIGKDVVFFDKIEELPFPDFIDEYRGFSINICRDGWAQITVADKKLKMTKCDVFFVNSLDKIQAVEYSDDFLMQTIWVSPLIMEMVHHECPLSLEYGITIPFFKACCPDDELLAAPARFVKTWPDEIKLSSASKPPAISDCCPRTKFSCSFDLLTDYPRSRTSSCTRDGGHGSGTHLRSARTRRVALFGVACRRNRRGVQERA